MANAVAIARNNGGAVQQTVLGGHGSAVRIPVGGKIRAGIKVLTKAAASNPQAVALYESGVRDGLSFDVIERSILEAAPNIKNPLTPKNVPYFTVRPCDFPNLTIATEILQLFGEDRGEGLKLYRFPVIFPADQWQAVMPHELQAWGASERKFWSEYSEDGSKRYCKCYGTVKPGTRIFGGRKHVLRNENDGICDPEHCPEYQGKKCNLSGRFIFYIPGVRSLSAIELGTNSFYSMQKAIDKFESISFMRGGRLSGFLDRQGTPFYLTKVMREVPHIDADGRPVRVKQWLIELEAPVDVSALLRANEDDVVVAGADEAVRILEQGSGEPLSVVQPIQVSEPAIVGRTFDGDTGSVIASEGTAGSSAKKPTEGKTRPQSTATASPPPTTPRQTSPGRSSGAGSAVGEISIDDVGRAAESVGLDPFEFQQYADKRYGVGWRVSVNGRRKVFGEVEEARNDNNTNALKARIQEAVSAA